MPVPVPVPVLYPYNNKKREVAFEAEGSWISAMASDSRQYVAERITPTLEKALVDLCRAKPKDPVSYLANRLLELIQQVWNCELSRRQPHARALRRTKRGV